MLVTAPRTWTAVLLLGAAGLSGCAELPDLNREPTIDMRASTAQAIVAAIANPGAYPSFADIPPVPSVALPADRPANTLPPIGKDVLALAGPAEDMTAASDAFASQQRAAIAGVNAPAQSDAAEIEAFAAAQRARAIPPSGR